MKTIKPWHKFTLSILIYTGFIVLLWLPVWVPRDWLIIEHAATVPGTETKFSTFWGIWLLTSLLSLGSLGCMQISKFSEAIVNRIYGRTSVTCYVEMTQDLVSAGLTEQKALDIVTSWLYKYNVQDSTPPSNLAKS